MSVPKIGIYLPEDRKEDLEKWRNELNLSELFWTAFDKKVKELERKKVFVKIHCRYFKKNGTFYSEGEGKFDKELFKGSIYPKEYGRILNEKHLLPGLISGSWDDPFTCTPEDSYTELIYEVPQG